MIIAPTIISLREGIEAALIIAIMLSYLRKTGQEHMRKYVIVGMVVAIIVSLVAAGGMAIVWGVFEGPILAVFEGSVVLVAAILLTTMILWMWQAGAGVTSHIEESMEMSSTQKSGIGLALLAFALILREGVELVLFTAALIIQEGVETYLGISLGLFFAVLIGLGIYQGSLRFSLRSFFNWTSVLLILFAAGMVAYGVHELQEAGFLLFGPLEVWNINPPVPSNGDYPLFHEKGLIGGLAKSLFGYNGNPSALEVISYVSYLFLVALYYVVKKKKIGE